MPEYEITYLTDPGLADDARTELDRQVDDAIEKMGGAVEHSAPANRRRLHYLIKKQLVGFARAVQVTLPADQIEPLRQDLRKMSGVMRVSVLSTSQREELTTAIFDAVAKKSGEAKKAETAPAQPVSMQEVEEKIAEALKEEVK